MDTRIKIGVIIVDSSDNILLIKEKIKKKKVPLWNVIKGSYGGNGNEGIFDTAIRECLEEISVSVELKYAIGCYISKKEDKIRVQFNFLAKIVNGKPRLPKINEQSMRDEAIFEVRWFSKEKILKMKPDEFISARTHALILDWLSGKKYPLEIYKQVTM